MSDKPYDQLEPIDRLVRQTIKTGMTVGTLLRIEFVSGFELFNTRPYHNYETWSQGWRITGKGTGETEITVEREDLDDAIAEWVRRYEAGTAKQ